MLDLHLFITAYQQLSSVDKMKIDSSYIPDAIRQVLGQNANPDAFDLFVKVIAFRTLNIIDDTTAINELSVGGVVGAHTLYQQILQQLATTPVPAVTAPDELVIEETEIAEMEAALQSVPQVRTMATDMQLVREQGNGEYSSSQAAMLTRDAITPTPSDPEEARWNSTNHY